MHKSQPGGEGRCDNETAGPSQGPSMFVGPTALSAGLQRHRVAAGQSEQAQSRVALSRGLEAGQQQMKEPLHSLQALLSTRELPRAREVSGSEALKSPSERLG